MLPLTIYLTLQMKDAGSTVMKELKKQEAGDDVVVPAEALRSR
jgi:hypothetical protein